MSITCILPGVTARFQRVLQLSSFVILSRGNAWKSSIFHGPASPRCNLQIRSAATLHLMSPTHGGINAQDLETCQSTCLLVGIVCRTVLCWSSYTLRPTCPLSSESLFHYFSNGQALKAGRMHFGFSKQKICWVLRQLFRIKFIFIRSF